MPDIRIQKYKNPIISGYNPDPSICRVGDDFYLVCRGGIYRKVYGLRRESAEKPLKTLFFWAFQRASV